MHFGKEGVGFGDAKPVEFDSNTKRDMVLVGLAVQEKELAI